jgi:UrcA family protein
MRIIQTIQTIAMVATCTAVLAAAAAPTYAETLSWAVSTRGLDLRLPADQAALRHRIVAAARWVCIQDDNSPIDSLEVRDCQKAAFDAGWAQAEVRIAAARTNTVVASAAAK